MKLTDILLNEQKNCGCGQTPCKTYGVNEELNVSRNRLDKLAHNIGFEEFAKVILSLADENILDDIVDAMNFSEKDGTSYYNPDVLKEEKK